MADVILATGDHDLVLVMDNASWIQNARILSCGSVSMIAPLHAFARLLIKYPHARIFMLFNDRTKGKEADAISGICASTQNLLKCYSYFWVCGFLSWFLLG